jgi:hypothetical protein
MYCVLLWDFGVFTYHITALTFCAFTLVAAVVYNLTLLVGKTVVTATRGQFDPEPQLCTSHGCI